MNKKELLPLLDELGVHPGKRFGQNFMIDDNLLDFICRRAAPKEGDNILEIGPGLGSLTRKLLASGAKVTAIELDKRLAEYLQKTISNPNFKLVIGDACRINLAELFQSEFRIVANLPYSISSPFIADTLQIETPPTEMIFMLQKETGMRLSSGPGTKNYGSLSVTVQAVYNVEYLRTVSPQVFFPVPEVESAILKFTRKKDYLPLVEREIFRNLVRTAFSQRRKKMFKQISAIFDPVKITTAMNSLNISKDARAEELTVKQFVALAKMLT